MHPVAIIAGGVALRMRPRTETVPKSLLPVAGRPFIAHQLTRLRDQQITDVVLCVGHLGEQVQAFVGDGRAWGLRVRYSFDGPQLLGTGGALRRAQPLLGDTFFTLYGDSYLTCDFAAVSRAFAASSRLGLMTVYRNDNTLGPSNVALEGGRIVRYDKASPHAAMRHIDYGLSILSAAALTRYDDGMRFDLSRVFEDLLTEGQLAAFEVDERFYEIGSPEGLRDTEALLAEPRPVR